MPSGLYSYPSSLHDDDNPDKEPLIINPNPPSYRRSTKPSALAQQQHHTDLGVPPDYHQTEPQSQSQLPPPTRKSKIALIRSIAKTVVHPQKTRTMRKAKKLQFQESEETERVRNIEEFLENGRRGPKRFGLDYI